MTQKESKAVLKSIITSMGSRGTSFTMNKDVAFLSPLEDCYRGICINPSQLSKESFNVEVFFLPLYIPTQNLHFGIGWQLYSGKRSWDMSRTEEIASLLTKDALPLLEKGDNPTSLLTVIQGLKKDGVLHVVLAIMAVAAKVNDEKVLLWAHKKFTSMANPDDFPWQQEMLKYVEDLRELYTTNPTGLVSFFEEWKQRSVKTLKIGTFLD